MPSRQPIAVSGIAPTRPAAVWLLVASAFMPRAGWAADDIAEQWRAVNRIEGTIMIEHRSWIHEGGFSPPTTADTRETAQVRFRMVIDHGSETSSSLTWRAEAAMITGLKRDEVEAVPYGRSTTEADFSDVAARLSDFTLTLKTDTGAWQIVSPGSVQKPYPVVTQYYDDDPRTDTAMTDTVPIALFDGTVAGKPGVTNGNHTDEGLIDKKPTRGYSKSARIQFWPEFDDAEVEVTIDGYATWRPLGSVEKPAEAGNHLLARATLVPKGGQTQDLPEVKRFRFALLDTSREPGVAMNWPLGANDTDYDLRLTAAPAFTGTVSDNGQQIDVEQTQGDEQGRPFALAQIDSYDFGGRSSLSVVCTLADGREIVGVMKSEGGEQDLVRLPKMKGPDWIAESWRNDKKVEKPADDDDEKVEGQQYNGDGYTLYEEYRGFVVAGKRIEGDPEKKDFFVLNLIGADATPGIELFEELSQLRVHAKLRRSEMSQTTRLMNGNHRDAPHRVDQHGVWVKTFTRAGLGDDGADTPMTKRGVAGRPGITKGVGILARDNADSAFNKPFNLPAQDVIFQYDRAIAHELLHSVGVEHHGNGDYSQIVGYVSPRNFYNRVGRPYFSTALDKPPIPLLDEAGHDVATQYYEAYVALRKILDAGFRDDYITEGRHVLDTRKGYKLDFKTPEQYADIQIEMHIFLFLHLQGTVGVEHGAHSGHQDCVMRYSFAKFYEKKNSADKSLYMVTPGSERIGMQICRAPLGTGINAADHQPQSRYGNAAAGEGNCFAQICPNDAIPPRKVN
ncbi:MAG: hypothetical protein HY941_12400 [Gammaproteobacteria bacterium]|nr:hypothetical protein [Gammaproteobacteria bacterium]